MYKLFNDAVPSSEHLHLNFQLTDNGMLSFPILYQIKNITLLATTFYLTVSGTYAIKLKNYGLHQA
jgi:hypothetical protein